MKCMLPRVIQKVNPTSPTPGHFEQVRSIITRYFPARWAMGFSKSKSFCADSPGGSPLTLRYRDAAERREKGRLCFIEGKGTPFISNNRNFTQEKVDISRNHITTPKNKWTFLRKRSCFAFFFPTSSRKSSAKPPPLSALSSRTRTCARTDTHLHIAHSTSLFFLPSPFTVTPNSLSHCGLRVKETINLTFHR